MPIPAEYVTSNPVVRDLLAQRSVSRVGQKVGDFVAPDVAIDHETVDVVTSQDHSLDLDDLRAPDAEAKEVRFGFGAVSTVSVVERAQKSKLDTRKIEDAQKRGSDIIADRAEMHRDDILDAKEYRIGQITTTAANFGATHKDVTGLNFRTGDLINLIDTWRETIITDGYFDAEYAIIGTAAWRHIRRNTAMQSFAGGGGDGAQGNNVTLANFADFVGLKEVRLARFRRKLGNATTFTEFWPVDSFLLFARQNSLSDRTFAATPYVPYGPAFRPTNPMCDVRTENLPGTERLTEIGAYHRYRTKLFNANLGFLVTGIVGT